MDLYDQLSGSWEERLEHILETMRDISRQTEPEALVAIYSDRLGGVFHDNRVLSLSRRGVEPPAVILTRDSNWEHQPNVWTERDQLPVFHDGFLSDVAYAGQVRLERDLVLDDNDPAAELLRGYRTLICIPIFDGGEPINTLILASEEPDQIKEHVIPHLVWMVNLFARGSLQLVTARALREAHAALDREAALIGEIQRRLLPSRLPAIENLEVAIHYEPAEHAGGDYYDFFPLAGGRWAILVADVSGHGSPAAVVMAITRTLAHVAGTGDASPRSILTYVNQHLCTKRSVPDGSFVTAFLAVFDPESREISYTLAGHPPPRVHRCSSKDTFELLGARALPLGIMADQIYRETSFALAAGDQLVIYTDGITEAANADRVMFGTERLDACLQECGDRPQQIIDRLLANLREFTGDEPFEDDVTLLALRVS